MEKKFQTLTIKLENVHQADAIALMKMFNYMQYLGSIGSSRMCSFFADGDGAFRPKVSFEYPEDLPNIPEISGVVEWDDEQKKLKGCIKTQYVGDFVIDSDSIAWDIYHKDE
jgi:hypothetical protein